MNDKLFSALLALLLSVSAVNAMSDTSAARPDWQLLSTTEDPDKTISWFVDRHLDQVISRRHDFAHQR